MRTYVLIGGIGSGKSMVLEMFGGLGAQCIDLDAIGHDVLGWPETCRELFEVFGPDVFDADGAVNRRALAKRAFASPESTEALNAITQPRIVQRAQEMLDDLEAQGCPVAVVEISPYAGFGGAFDPLVEGAQGIVAVVAPDEVRVRRAIERGLPEADVRNRIARQATDDQRRAWADIVVENDATLEDLRQSVQSAWNSMTSAADRDILEP